MHFLILALTIFIILHAREFYFQKKEEDFFRYHKRVLKSSWREIFWGLVTAVCFLWVGLLVLHVFKEAELVQGETGGKYEHVYMWGIWLESMILILLFGPHMSWKTAERDEGDSLVDTIPSSLILVVVGISIGVSGLILPLVICLNLIPAIHKQRVRKYYQDSGLDVQKFKVIERVALIKSWEWFSLGGCLTIYVIAASLKV